MFGVIDPGRLKSPALGIASYPHAYMLLSNVPNVEAMKYAFLHELCHIFGAIDLKEKGSVMGVVEPGLGIDRFTSEIVLLNRDRSFDRSVFPLAGSAIDAAIEHYKDRADLRRGEPQTLLFLTLLYLEKNDIEAARRGVRRGGRHRPGHRGTSHPARQHPPQARSGGPGH